MWKSTAEIIARRDLRPALRQRRHVAAHRPLRWMCCHGATHACSRRKRSPRYIDSVVAHLLNFFLFFIYLSRRSGDGSGRSFVRLSQIYPRNGPVIGTSVCATCVFHTCERRASGLFPYHVSLHGRLRTVCVRSTTVHKNVSHPRRFRGTRISRWQNKDRQLQTDCKAISSRQHECDRTLRPCCAPGLGASRRRFQLLDDASSHRTMRRQRATDSKQMETSAAAHVVRVTPDEESIFKSGFLIIGLQQS